MELRFFYPRVFYWLALGTGLGRSSVTNWKSCKQYRSILKLVTKSYKFALILTTTIFFTIKIEFSNLRSLFYSLAKLNSFRPFRKYFNILGLAGTLIEWYYNKIDYKYSRCTTYFNINSCWYWKMCLNWLRMLLAKVLLSSRFFQKKFLNSAHVIASFALKQHLY